jgi:hypothetical protein
MYIHCDLKSKIFLTFFLKKINYNNAINNAGLKNTAAKRNQKSKLLLLLLLVFFIHLKFAFSHAFFVEVLVFSAD